MSTELPWDDATVDRLNAHQRGETPFPMHPYTCNGGNPDFDTHHEGGVILFATRDGWKCPLCDRTQDWY